MCGVVISTAKEESKGGEEFGFLDSEIFEESNVSCSFLPIEINYLLFQLSRRKYTTFGV